MRCSRFSIAFAAILVSSVCLGQGAKPKPAPKPAANQATGPMAGGSGKIEGKPDAKWIVVEFLDYDCLPCKQADAVMRNVVKEHADVAWYVRQKPLASHRNAETLAALALVADDRKRLVPVQAMLFETLGTTLPTRSARAAQIMGLDPSKLNELIRSEAIQRRLATEIRSTKELGVDSTPTFFLIGNQSVMKGSDPRQIVDYIR